MNSPLESLLRSKAALKTQKEALLKERDRVINELDTVTGRQRTNDEDIHNAIGMITCKPAGNVFKIGDKYYVVTRTTDPAFVGLSRYILEEIHPLIIE